MFFLLSKGGNGGEGHPSSTSLPRLYNRDKTRVQIPTKNVSSFEIIMLALGFDTKQRNIFLIKFVFCFFTIKTRFSQYYSWINMRKSHFNDEFLVLLGPIISRFFACSNEEKNQNNKGCVL